MVYRVQWIIELSVSLFNTVFAKSTFNWPLFFDFVFDFICMSFYFFFFFILFHLQRTRIILIKVVRLWGIPCWTQSHAYKFPARNLGFLSQQLKDPSMVFFNVYYDHLNWLLWHHSWSINLVRPQWIFRWTTTQVHATLHGVNLLTIWWNTSSCRSNSANPSLFNPDIISVGTNDNGLKVIYPRKYPLSPN